jgi:biopolymer transport protein ExbB
LHEIWQFLVRGGPVMIPLGLCSAVAATITFERILALRRGQVLPREIVSVVESVAPGRDLQIALDVCSRNPGVFSDIMRVGLEHAGDGWQAARDAILDAGRQHTPRIERHLVWLETVATAAPLLGLLGTVTGMMKVFGSISAQGLGDPHVLSAGIAEAMITTAVGLGIGIPALVAFNLLSARAEAWIVEIENQASLLVSRLRGGQSA